MSFNQCTYKSHAINSVYASGTLCSVTLPEMHFEIIFISDRSHFKFNRRHGSVETINERDKKAVSCQACGGDSLFHEDK